MLKLYDNSHINREKWDSLIDSSEQGVIYAKSWYLDILFPDWKALISVQDGTYVTGVPFCPKSRFGVRSIHHPYFSQQLGIFSCRKEDEAEILHETIEYWIRNFHYADYFFNNKNSDSINRSAYKTAFRKRITYLLYLSPDFDDLKQNFSKNNLRNLKKAAQNKIRIATEPNPDPLIELFRNNKGTELAEITDSHYELLRRIIEAANKIEQVKIVSARTENGELISGAIFLFYKEKIIYLFGSGSEQAKKTGAFPSIFEQLIREYAGTDKILDFEGSEIEGLARFYAGFGASPAEFHAFHLNKVEWIVKLRKLFSKFS